MSGMERYERDNTFCGYFQHKTEKVNVVKLLPSMVLEIRMIHGPQRTLFQTLTIPPPEACLPLQESIL
jgi:hypothetical protein